MSTHRRAPKSLRIEGTPEHLQVRALARYSGRSVAEILTGLHESAALHALSRTGRKPRQDRSQRPRSTPAGSAKQSTISLARRSLLTAELCNGFQAVTRIIS